MAIQEVKDLESRVEVLEARVAALEQAAAPTMPVKPTRGDRRVSGEETA